VPILKRIAARLPQAWQHELRRRFFRNQIRSRNFATDEKEYELLDKFLRPGDWAMDVGANVGHYTMRMSDLVGPGGRVIAIEPVPDTFALLAGNVRLFERANVSLFNLAASDRLSECGIFIPRFSEGLQNYYQARLVTDDAEAIHVLTLPLDALALPETVRLVKIDVEGHELAVLRGMSEFLARARPVIIVETSAEMTVDFLRAMNYVTERLPGSSNLLCTQHVEGLP
jgi:FkbM family methyltransferase